MADSKDIQIIIKAVDNATTEIKNVGRALDNVSGNVDKTSVSFKSMSAAVAVGNLAYSAIYGVIRSVTSGITDLIKESVVLNGELGQSKAVIYKLGENNNWTKNQIDGLVKSIRDENKDMLTAIELTKTAIMTNMSETQALEIVARGRDVAAASNRNSNEAIKAMMEAVVKLRPELLSEYGIQMNLIKVYSDAAEQLGIKTAEMTYAQKTQAMYNAIIQEATRMEGSYTEAMGSWYKVSNSVKDGIIELKLVLGDMLDGAMKPIIDYVYNAIKAFRAWAFTDENEINPSLQAMADIIGQSLTGAFMGLMAAVTTISDIFKWFADIIRQAIDLVTQYKGVLEIFKSSWDNIVVVFREHLLPQLQKLWEVLTPLKPFLEVFAQVIGVMLFGALIAVVKIIEVSLIATIEVMTQAINGAILVINFFKSAWDGITSAISKVIDTIDRAIAKIKSLNLLQGAKNAIGGLLGFDTGGIVPGPIGSPQLAVVHGGETILPTHKTGGASAANNTTININISGNTLLDNAAGERIGAQIVQQLKYNLRFST